MTISRFSVLPLVAAVILLSAGGVVYAQQQSEIAALQKEIEALKAGQAALQKDIQEIKNMLRPAQQQGAVMDAPPDVKMETAGSPSKGSADAKVVLIEFSDYQCPFCGRYTRDAFAAIDRDYVQTGKVRYVFRSFPLESIHKLAFKASEAALCAGEQGKYWAMHDRLFMDQAALAPAGLVAAAKAAGLDMAAFQPCLDSGRMAPAIRKDIAAGTEIGVRGTPLFLIGTSGPGATVTVLKAISGAQPYAVFQQTFDDLLKAK